MQTFVRCLLCAVLVVGLEVQRGSSWMFLYHIRDLTLGLLLEPVLLYTVVPIVSAAVATMYSRQLWCGTRCVLPFKSPLQDVTYTHLVPVAFLLQASYWGPSLFGLGAELGGFSWRCQLCSFFPPGFALALMSMLERWLFQKWFTVSINLLHSSWGGGLGFFSPTPGGDGAVSRYFSAVLPLFCGS
jgi:hypothetical protein